MRTLLNSLSTVEIVLIFVGGSIALAITLTFAIRRLAPDIAETRVRGARERAARRLRAAVRADPRVRDRVGARQVQRRREHGRRGGHRAVADAARQPRVPDRAQSRLSDGIHAYIVALVDDEWETMRHGESQPRGRRRARHPLRALPGATSRRPASPTSSTTRRSRISTPSRRRAASASASANARLPTILVLMLPVGALLLLVLEYRPQLRPRGQVGVHGDARARAVVDLPADDPARLPVLGRRLGHQRAAEVAARSRTSRAARRASRRTATSRASSRRRCSPASSLGCLRDDRAAPRGARDARRRTGTADGSVRGAVGADGVFRGVWCEGSQRAGRRDAGLVEWRLDRDEVRRGRHRRPLAATASTAGATARSSPTAAGTCTARARQGAGSRRRLAAEPDVARTAACAGSAHADQRTSPERQSVTRLPVARRRTDSSTENMPSAPAEPIVAAKCSTYFRIEVWVLTVPSSRSLTRPSGPIGRSSRGRSNVGDVPAPVQLHPHAVDRAADRAAVGATMRSATPSGVHGAVALGGRAEQRRRRAGSPPASPKPPARPPRLPHDVQRAARARARGGLARRSARSPCPTGARTARRAARSACVVRAWRTAPVARNVPSAATRPSSRTCPTRSGRPSSRRSATLAPSRAAQADRHVAGLERRCGTGSRRRRRRTPRSGCCAAAPGASQSAAPSAPGDDRGCGASTRRYRCA